MGAILYTVSAKELGLAWCFTDRVESNPSDKY